MASSKTKNKNGRKDMPKISPAHCPEGMTLKEWQRALRRQAAEKEKFGITKPQSSGDPFIVSSAKSGRKYRVEYFGKDSMLNRCECMDFKTSRLGTCKHIEAISQAYSGRLGRKIYPLPEHTSVYVDYVHGRKIKIRRGTIASDDMDSLISTLFNSDGTITDMNSDPTVFIKKAISIDEGFEWESDAMNLVIEARDKERRRRLIAEKYAEASFDGLIKTGLHPYQADGVRFAFSEGRTINADEMGLGKTVQAISTAELLKREHLVDSVIIICPTSLKYQWQSEIKRFTDSSVMVIEGNVMKRREQFDTPEAFYKICSFHSMSNTIKSGYVPAADMIIYDELQRLKNRETQMGRQLRKLESQYVMALSGTPLENKLDELYSVVQFVDQYALGPYYEFVNETTLTDETGRVTGYRNLHSVSERLSHRLIRRRKADVRLQMPARTDTNLFVPMTKEQQAIHDEYKFQVGGLIHKWHRFKFLSEADRKRLLLFLSMMRMVCDSTFILDQKSRHDTKIEEIMAIIANLLSDKDSKVVIFSQWERMLRILATELERNDIDFCFLHGGVPSLKRKSLIDRFQEDPDCRIFLSTDAGATGLNLQAATLLINIDLPWNPAVLEQRIARIYRLGQNNPVQIINMISRGTIEEQMLSTLSFKSNLAAGILDGGDDAVFLENKKFEKIVEVVDCVVNDSGDNGGQQEEKRDKKLLDKQGQEQPGVPNATDDTDTEVNTNGSEPAMENAHGGTHPAEKPDMGNDTGERTSPGTAGTINSHDKNGTVTSGDKPAVSKSRGEVCDVVSEGLKALGRFADILRNPEGAEMIADALVKEDPATGETSLNIPVPDKTTVVSILSAFSMLLNKGTYR